MALRKEWQAAKSLAETAFKKDHPVQGDVHMTPPTPYPVKFKEDLGPTLDDYEKAKTPPDKQKYAKKGKDVIKNYRNAITSAKDMKTAGKILLETLAKIEKALV